MLERWKRLRCVQLDDTDRLICNMTLSGQVMTLTWGQIFKLTFQGQVIVHSMRLDERNTMPVKVSSYKAWVKSYCRKTVSEKNRLFLQFLPSAGKTVDVRSNLRELLRKGVNRAIECAFPRRCSSIGSRVMRWLLGNFRHSTWKSAKFCLQWPLVTWPLTWPKNWPKWFRHYFWRSFERRLPRIATWPRSRVTRGVFKHPPPAGRGNPGPPAGRGLTFNIYI